MLTNHSFYSSATDRLMPKNLFQHIKINSQETIDNEYDFNRLISHLESGVTITLDLSNVKLADGKFAQIMDPLIAKARVSELNIPYSSLNETELQLIPKLTNLKKLGLKVDETIKEGSNFNNFLNYLKSNSELITTLDLSDCKLSYQDIGLIPELTNLKKLGLKVDKTIKEGSNFNNFLNYLKSSSELITTLDLSDCKLSYQDIGLIPELTNLKKLGLKVDKTIKEGSNFNNFLNYLKSNSKLITTLDLSDCKLSYQDIELIPKLTNLEKLGLKVKSKTITEESNFNNFLNYLKLNNKLITTLDLSEIDLSDGKLAQIINALPANPSLTELNLSDCNLDDEDIELIPKLTNLKKLIIDYNGIGSKGAKYISQLLQLEYLDINYNDIEVKGAKHISRLINLRHLEVDENEVGADGAEHLSKLINLEYLSISENALKKEGAIHIARLTKLNHLFINNNGIKGNATKRLVDHLTQLRVLDIGRNDLTDDDAKCIATKLIYLESLDISLNNIGEDGIKCIQERPRPFKHLDTEQRPRR
jgi:Leucine-rich repeat (LRR) protein